MNEQDNDTPYRGEPFNGKNVLFSYAVNAYRRYVRLALKADEKTQDWLFHTFHSMHLQNPGLLRTRIHDHNEEELVERVLKNAGPIRKLMSYKQLMPKFLEFCRLKGWSPKAEKGANLIQLPPSREYPYRPRNHRNKPEE